MDNDIVMIVSLYTAHEPCWQVESRIKPAGRLVDHLNTEVASGLIHSQVYHCGTPSTVGGPPHALVFATCSSRDRKT